MKRKKSRFYRVAQLCYEHQQLDRRLLKLFGCVQELRCMLEKLCLKKR